jgi:hypothetical protein
VRLCRRLDEWLGLLRLRAAVSVRMPREDRDCAAKGLLTLALTLRDKAALPACEGEGTAVEARESSRGLLRGD